MQVSRAVLPLQNGSIIRNSASLLGFSRAAEKHPLSKGLAKALWRRAGFPLCLCCGLDRVFIRHYWFGRRHGCSEEDWSEISLGWVNYWGDLFISGWSTEEWPHSRMENVHHSPFAVQCMWKTLPCSWDWYFPPPLAFRNISLAKFSIPWFSWAILYGIYRAALCSEMIW